ncbi:MAG: T9SS type A sorting domain-containing protein, partial [Pedobacter sp.]
LDIFVFGNDDTGKSKILFNSAGTGFTESTQFDGYSFVDPVVSVIDYDNDKDLDLFISAGFEAGLNTRFSKLFVNNGGVFTETTITGLLPKGNGSVTWGDYNADGFADLLLNGDGYINSGEDADNYRLYRNNGNGTFTTIRAFNYRQNFTNGGGRFFDWDNDGDLDIVVTGWDGSRQATDIYINDQGGFSAYVNNAAIPGSSEGAVEIGDADNDGDLDLFITGFSGNDWDGAGTVAPFNRNIAVVALNPTNNTNAAPTVPTNIQVTGSASQLNFSWTASTDATTPQKALTYNMFLVDANGKWFYYPLADTTSGKNKIARLGNVQQNTGWYVKNLPAGTYRWGVQAIDNSYKGSAFAKGSFRISSSGTLPVTIGAYNVVKESDHAVLKWTSLSESNVDKYIVERSLDGKSFETISTIPATGAGNYSFRDRSPSSGNNYYRLTSLDKDGTSQVFEVLSLNFQLSQSGILLYPNPLTTSELNLQLNGYQGKVTVKLIDITGRVLEASTINATATNNYYKVQLKQKPSAGIYKIN